MSDINHSTNPDKITPAGKATPRLPFKEVTIYPSQALRQRILEIQLKTGETASAILEKLVCAAAGVPIEWTVVEPKNGDAAGVSLKKVEEAQAKTFFMLRDVKGIIRTHGREVAQSKMDELLHGSIELWAHAQSLAKDTFYNHVGLVAGRTTFRWFSNWKTTNQRTLDQELAEGEKADADAVTKARQRVTEYTEVLRVLTRLGFSPQGPIREN